MLQALCIDYHSQTKFSKYNKIQSRTRDMEKYLSFNKIK
jgi:hypothetical protein